MLRNKKAKKNDQEAHEALRPVHLDVEVVEDVSSDAKKIYKMIHRRTLLSLMPSGFDIEVSDLFKKGSNLFLHKKTYIADKGFRLSKEAETIEELPKEVAFDSVIEKIDTKPKPLFTPASLIKEMKKVGIGRPSTYSTITTSLEKNDYLSVDKKNNYIVSELGWELVKFTNENLKDFLSVATTSFIEEKLDKISCGEAEKWNVVDDF